MRFATLSFPSRSTNPEQDVLDKLDDATTELMTGEGDSVMLMLGESFMECEEEYATEYCERKQEVAWGIHFGRLCVLCMFTYRATPVPGGTRVGWLGCAKGPVRSVAHWCGHVCH